MRQVGIEYVGKATGLTKATKEAEGQLDDFAESAEKSGEKAGEGLGSKLTGKMQTATAGLSKIGAVAGVGTGLAFGASLVGAMGKQDVNAKLSGQLNLTKKQSAQIGKVAGHLFTQNYGDSLEDTSDAVAAVRQNIKGMATASSKDLETSSKYALNFAHTMGVDVGEAAVSAGALVNNGLAKNATQAFDLLTAGAQKAGPQMTGPLLDATNEYSKHFKMLGIDGKSAMGTLASAASGGEIAIDKAGDAIKEFGIRATDLNDTGAQQSLKTLGLNGKKTADQLLAGGKTANKATQRIAKGLLSIKDPSKQAAVASGLFGTQIEDIGKDNIPGFLKGLAGTTDGLGKVNGRAKNLDKTLNDTASNNLAKLTKGFQSAFVSLLGDKVVPIVTTLTGGLTGNQTAMQILVGVVLGLGAGITALSVAMKVVTVATEAWSVAQKVAGVAAKGFSLAMKAVNASFLTNPIFLVIAGLVALGAGLVLAYKKSATFRKIVNGAFSGVKKVAGAVVGWFTGSVVPFFTKTLPGAFHSTVGWVKKNWPLLLGILTGPIGLAVVGIVKHKDQIVGAFKSAKKWVTGAFKKGWAATTKVLTAPVDAGQKVIGGILGVGGKVAKKFTDTKHWVGSTWKKGWAAASGWISGSVSKGKDQAATALTKVQGKLTDLRKWGGSKFKTGWSNMEYNLAHPIQFGHTLIGKAKSGIQGTLNGLDNFGSKVFGKHWSGMESVIQQPIAKAKSYLKDVFGPGGGGVRQIFSDMVTAAGKIFAKIQGAIAKPVKWVVDHVINGVLISGINKIGNFVGMGGKDKQVIAPLSTKGLARGGILPGFTPVHRGDDQYRPMRSGEGVAVSEMMRDPYERGRLLEGNRVALRGGRSALRKWRMSRDGLALGGIVRPINAPISNGLHDQYTGYPAVDAAASVGHPVVAAAGGKVIQSYDITGYEPRNTTQNGYRSYGRVIVMQNDGFQTLYAHLSQRLAGVGATLKAGQQLGLSGNTGHSTGPHLHFGAKGKNPNDFWQSTFGKVISAIGGFVSSVGGKVGQMLDPGKLLTGAVSKAMKGAGALAGSPFGQMVAKVPPKLASMALGWAKDKVFGGAVGGGGAGEVAGKAVLRQALTMNGVPATSTNVNAWWRQVQTESGDNPGAIQQIHDINSVNGNLARGWLQVIPPTFAAYHLPGHNNIMAKLDNALAAINYWKHAYGGNIGVIGRGYGYDQGGMLPTGTSMVHNDTGRPERVLTDAQWSALAGGQRQQITINVNGALDPLATARQIRKLLKDLARAEGGVQMVIA
jgi:murein DD-endopeptidase MepM/ murein hydrolase activator NlpD/phage-related minor tail protein